MNFKTSRGFDADCIIVDEASFVSKDLLMDTIIPVLGQGKTAFIAISTALDDNNSYTILTKLEDEDGKLLFCVIRIGQICDACKKTDTPWLCPHKAYEVPPWKSQKKMNKFKFIYAGQQHRNLRENFGEIAGDENSAFRSNLIDEFAAQEYYPDPIKTRAIYVAVDPTGGGKSALSFFAVTNDAGMWVVLAVVYGECTNKSADEKLMTEYVIKKLEDKYKDAVIILIPEYAMGLAPDHIAQYVRNNPKVCLMRETPNRVVGVPKTNATTLQMATQFDNVLSLQTLRIAQNLIVYKNNKEAVKSEFVEQMRNMEWERLGSNTGNWKLSGKKKGNDDIMVTGMMAVYWPQIFLSSNYSDYYTYQKYIRTGSFERKSFSLNLASGNNRYL